MNKLFILFIFSFFLFSCAGTAKREFKGTIDYNLFQKELSNKLPNAQINKLDSTKVIELEAYQNIKGAENRKIIEVKKGEKLHIVKHSETELISTSFEAVLYNVKDTLYCGVIMPFGDAEGHGNYILNIINNENIIKTPKSHFFYSMSSIFSPTISTLYLTHSNPLFSTNVKSISISLGISIDLLTVLGILSLNDIIEKDSNTKPLGKSFLGLGILGRILAIMGNEYIKEYNRYIK